MNIQTNLFPAYCGMMESNFQTIWETEHVIRSYELDLCHEIRLAVLYRMMQEAGWQHAEHLGLGHSCLSQNNLAWVLTRQRIEVARYPGLGETLHLKTWPSDRDRLFFHRDFEIADSKGRTVAQAATAWCVMNLETREIERADQFKLDDIPVGKSVFNEKLKRLGPVAVSEGAFKVRVGYNDLDTSEHVNNARFVEWLLDEVPLAYHKSHEIFGLKINFLGEAAYGDELAIAREERAESCFAHRITKGGEEICRALSHWQKVES